MPLEYTIAKILFFMLLIDGSPANYLERAENAKVRAQFACVIETARYVQRDGDLGTISNAPKTVFLTVRELGSHGYGVEMPYAVDVMDFTYELTIEAPENGPTKFFGSDISYYYPLLGAGSVQLGYFDNGPRPFLYMVPNIFTGDDGKDEEGAAVWAGYCNPIDRRK